jgi:hypothetical protein
MKMKMKWLKIPLSTLPPFMKLPPFMTGRMKNKEQKFVVKYFWMTGWRSKKIHEELITPLGDDAYGLSQIKI